MSTSLNAAPRSILEGIKDESGRVPAYTPDQIPTFCPHLYFFAERGDTLPNLVVGDSMTRMYGAKSFELNGPYATHQTVLVNEVNAAGNRFFAQRIIPADAAPRATLMLWLDHLVTKVPLYVYNDDGSLATDQAGNPIPVLDTDDEPVLIDGHSFKWVLTESPKVNSDGEVITSAMISAAATDPSVNITPVDNAFGVSVQKAGTQTDATTSTISKLYPIFEWEVSNIGEYGNLLGLRLSAVHARSPIPGDIDLSQDLHTFFYRIQMVQRETAVSTPLIWETLNGAQDVVFSFNKNAVNQATNVNYYWKKRITQAYEDFSDPVPVYGPFGRMHVYEDYLKTISEAVQATESAINTAVSDAAEDVYLINLISAQDLLGNPYRTVRMLGVQGGGVSLTPNATHYAAGGSNGTMDFATFDAAVADQLANYGDLEADLMDSAKYPVSAVIDTGFTINTKKKFFVPMGRRKDIAAFVMTQDVSQPQNDEEAEGSTLITLREAARVYPESEIYGTSTCRAFILGQSGYLIDSTYEGLLPIGIELVAKLARYMGAGNGIWNPAASITKSPNNHVSMFRDINLPFKRQATYNQNWRNGLVWAQTYDRRANFVPAFRSVYDDETSILVSGINVLIACNLQRVAEEVWRDMVGDDSLTNEQWIEQSDERILRKVRGRYDGRVVVQPETYFTQEDVNNGFSNHCKIHMFGNNMKTQTTFTVVARRRSELEG